MLDKELVPCTTNTTKRIRLKMLSNTSINSRRFIQRRAPSSSLPYLLIALSCFHSTTTTTQGLNIALLTGSTRTSGPPTVLHPRVNTYSNNLARAGPYGDSHRSKRFTTVGETSLCIPTWEGSTKVARDSFCFE